MVDAHSGHLDREIHVFSRYLVGKFPDQYVLSRYRKAHELGALGLAEESGSFDRLVVGIARTSPWFTRWADAHTSVFGGNLFRRKLVLALGILENSPQLHAVIDSSVHKSRTRFLVALAGRAVVYFLAVVAGMLLFLPLRLVCFFLGTKRQN